MAELLYKAAGPQASDQAPPSGDGATSGNGASSGTGGEDVIDAEFKEAK
jgi:hypothetical protein